MGLSGIAPGGDSWRASTFLNGLMPLDVLTALVQASLGTPAAVKPFQFLAGNAPFTRERLSMARATLKKC